MLLHHSHRRHPSQLTLDVRLEAANGLKASTLVKGFGIQASEEHEMQLVSSGLVEPPQQQPRAQPSALVARADKQLAQLHGVVAVAAKEGLMCCCLCCGGRLCLLCVFCV